MAELCFHSFLGWEIFTNFISGRLANGKSSKSSNGHRVSFSLADTEKAKTMKIMIACAATWMVTDDFNLKL